MAEMSHPKRRSIQRSAHKLSWRANGADPSVQFDGQPIRTIGIHEQCHRGVSFFAARNNASLAQSETVRLSRSAAAWIAAFSSGLTRMSRFSVRAMSDDVGTLVGPINLEMAA
jgi:hypothetical protein